MNKLKTSDKLFEHTELKPLDLIKTIEGEVYEVSEVYPRENDAYASVVIDVTKKKDKEGCDVLAVPYDEIVSVKRNGEYLDLSHFDVIPASYDYVMHLKEDQAFTEGRMERILNSIKSHKEMLEGLENDLQKERRFHKSNQMFVKRLTEIKEGQR